MGASTGPKLRMYEFHDLNSLAQNFEEKYCLPPEPDKVVTGISSGLRISGSGMDLPPEVELATMQGGVYIDPFASSFFAFLPKEEESRKLSALTKMMKKQDGSEKRGEEEAENDHSLGLVMKMANSGSQPGNATMILAQGIKDSMTSTDIVDGHIYSGSALNPLLWKQFLTRQHVFATMCWRCGHMLGMVRTPTESKKDSDEDSRASISEKRDALSASLSSDEDVDVDEQFPGWNELEVPQAARTMILVWARLARENLFLRDDHNITNPLR